ncbi:hypothetical protein [Pontixanthobacter sp. CEM42]|uniref:hypothetical protein n=1 Tax=Pontixanthobacter sp. CEM42 TaxID=2792077 RepID=UPI001ADFDA87|nr:hypothetical protein [Pontixanthobacter sp. CEM42]
MSSNASNPRGPYLKPKNMGRRTAASIPKTKRKNTNVSRVKRDREEALRREQEALNELVRIADIRTRYMRGTIGAVDPILVYADFDENAGFLHDTNPKEFPEWNELTDAAKARIGFLLSLAFNGYSFTANVSGELERKWAKQGLKPRDRAIDKINKELKEVGLGNAPYFFVIEAKGRSGRSRTHLHLHGYCLLTSGHEATRFKTALEKALYRNLKVPKGHGPPVKIGPSFKKSDDPKDATYWAGYSLKNALLPGPKIEGTPLYLNTPLRQLAHEFWDIVRDVD